MFKKLISFIKIKSIPNKKQNKLIIFTTPSKFFNMTSYEFVSSDKKIINNDEQSSNKIIMRN